MARRIALVALCLLGTLTAARAQVRACVHEL
jgi:hypothetical protein